MAREYLGRRDQSADAMADLAVAPTADLLRQLGLLTVDGFLTEAGALLFCPAPRPWLSWTRVDVEGGVTSSRVKSPMSASACWSRLPISRPCWRRQMTLSPWAVSSPSVRYACFRPALHERQFSMGVVHRDWNLQEPTAVTWVEADSSLTVVSPGGFVGGAFLSITC